MPDAAALAGPLIGSSESSLNMLRWMLIGGVLSLAPALAIMTTSFVRIAVVLGILRQGFGGGQFLPTQVTTALSLFLTIGVMTPVWTTAWNAGLAAYAPAEDATDAERRAQLTDALARSVEPLRRFMALQVEASGNTAAVDLLLDYQAQWNVSSSPPQFYEDLPISVLLPAYVLSELKVAFVIGFQLLLPFVVIDILTASVINSLGATSLPAAWVAFPLKLLLFVLIDGWFLTAETLLASIRPFT
ncbi:MAG: EscR/YscR/HrcR family type III secretion system export apparatus protein [Planctomyces sp.]|nr:EscR/YscR/HrcR family type III secretion system export apparatus protein [Planctomyces sp.]